MTCRTIYHNGISQAQCARPAIAGGYCGDHFTANTLEDMESSLLHRDLDLAAWHLGDFINAGMDAGLLAKGAA